MNCERCGGPHYQSLLEQRAKRAYSIFCSRVLDRAPATPWEMLRNDQHAAWKEVTEFLQDEPDCPTCGEPMFCIDCNTDTGSRWEAFTPEERATIASALAMSRGFRPSHPWYVRCIELGAELTKFQEEKPNEPPTHTPQ